MSNDRTPLCDSLQPQLAGYALGEEQVDNELVEHIEACTSCQDDLQTYRRVTRLLPYSAPNAVPRPELRARILAAATQPQRARATFRRSWSGPLAWFTPRARLAFAGALAALVLLLGWNLTLQSRLNASVAQLSRSRESWQTMTRLLNDPTVRSVALQGERARGHIWVADNGDVACLVVEGLPEPGAGKVYQVWLRSADQPIGAGTFEARGGNGWTLIRAQRPIAEFDAIGVTIEPRGGSPAPTGQRVLFGTLDVLGGRSTAMLAATP